MNIFGDHVLSLEVIQLQKTILLFFIPILGKVFQNRRQKDDVFICRMKYTKKENYLPKRNCLQFSALAYL